MKRLLPTLLVMTLGCGDGSGLEKNKDQIRLSPGEEFSYVVRANYDIDRCGSDYNDLYQDALDACAFDKFQVRRTSARNCTISGKAREQGEYSVSFAVNPVVSGCANPPVCPYNPEKEDFKLEIIVGDQPRSDKVSDCIINYMSENKKSN